MLSKAEAEVRQAPLDPLFRRSWTRLPGALLQLIGEGSAATPEREMREDWSRAAPVNPDQFARSDLGFFLVNKLTR